MGIREDMEMLKFLQQQAAIKQGGMNQQMPIGFAQPAQMPQEDQGGAPSMQDMQQMGQMMQQEPQQQQQASAPRNPLEAGSRAAIEASKRSLEMNENENRRALGRAMIGMMSGISQSPTAGHGLAGNLGAINAGFAPALGAYDAERDRIMEMNYNLRNKQKEEEALARKEERELKKMAQEMDIEQKKLGINQGYLDIERNKKADERAELALLSKPGGEIPLGSLSTNGWIYAQKHLDSSAKEIEGAKNAINSIDEVSEILERNPKITKHWGTILSASQQEDPTYLKQQLLNRVNPQELKDAQLLSKNLSNLYTAGGTGFSARAMNKYWEKEMKKGVATPDLLASTTLHLFKDARKSAVEKYKNNYEVHDAFHNKGVFKRAKPSALDYDPEETTKYEKKGAKGMDDLDADQAEARKAQIRAQLGQ